MEAYLIATAYAFIQFLCIIMEYSPFSKTITKHQKNISVFVYSLILIINMILNIIAGLFGYMSVTYYKISFMIFNIITSGINMIIIRNKIREHLFICGLTTVIILMIFSVVTYIESKLYFDKNYEILLNIFMVAVVFGIFYPVIQKQLIYTVKPFLNINSGNYWKNVWVIPYAMSFTSYFAAPIDSYITSTEQILSRIFMTVATIFMCRSIAEDYKRMEEQLTITKQLNIQKEHYAALAVKVEEARKTRHDFKHHLSAISHFAETKNFEDLQKYCDDLIQRQYEDLSIPYTGNTAVDGVLYQYTVISKKENIKFETKGVFQNHEIADIDICVLLGNALDNAVTACKTADSERFITVSSKIEGNVLIISIQNSFDGIIMQNGETILSRKRHNQEGIGISSMKAICEKYSGIMKTEYDDKVFSVMFLLNINT